MSVALTLEKFHLGEIVGRYALDGARKHLYRLGRLPRADVQVFDTGADRVHAVIDLSERRAILRDMGSKAGTFINGRKICRAALKTDDEIVIGDTRLRVTLGTSHLSPPPIPKAADRPREVLIDKVATLTPHSLGHLSIYADFLRGKRKPPPHHRRLDVSRRTAQDTNPSLELVEPDCCIDDDTVVDSRARLEPREASRATRRAPAALAAAVVAVAIAAAWYGDTISTLSTLSTDDVRSETATVATERNYSVRAGDTLSLIAKRELGSTDRWKELYARNSEILADPSDLGIGLELIIPAQVH